MLRASSLLSFHHCPKYLESYSSSVILTGVLVSYLVFSYVFSDPGGKRKKFSRTVEQFPGPRKYPIVGTTPDMRCQRDEILPWLEKMRDRWGEVVRFWNFGSPQIFINSYDVAMQLLSKKSFLSKSDEFRGLASVGRCSLLGALPKDHPLKRKLLAPGFSLVAETCLEVITKHVYKMRENLSIFSNDEIIDILDLAQLCSIRIECETALGREIMMDLYEEDMRKLMNPWHKLLVKLAERSKPWITDFGFNRSKEEKEVQECLRTINRFGEIVIHLRRAKRQYLKSHKFLRDDNAEKDHSVKQEVFLDLLLDLEEEGVFTKEDVLHELNTYIVAGYKSVGTTAAWTLHLLASHPEYQSKVLEELKEIFPEHKGDSKHLPITGVHLNRMKYLEACIMEALRLYPVLPWLLRRANEDIELKDGRVIPAGVDVPINIFSIHRDPKHFPEPEKFMPERHLTWVSDSTSDNFPGTSSAKMVMSLVQKPAFLPFGAGPRKCPANVFAMHQLKVMLAHLILNYSWESVDQFEQTNMKLLFQGVLLPTHGINVKIRQRNL